MLCAAPPGHPLQKRTVVQWDIDGVLSADYAADESVSPQFGITAFAPLASDRPEDLGSAVHGMPAVQPSAVETPL